MNAFQVYDAEFIAGVRGFLAGRSLAQEEHDVNKLYDAARRKMAEGLLPPDEPFELAVEIVSLVHGRPQRPWYSRWLRRRPARPSGVLVRWIVLRGGEPMFWFDPKLLEPGDRSVVEVPIRVVMSCS